MSGKKSSRERGWGLELEKSINIVGTLKMRLKPGTFLFQEKQEISIILEQGNNGPSTLRYFRNINPAVGSKLSCDQWGSPERHKG